MPPGDKPLQVVQCGPMTHDIKPLSLWGAVFMLARIGLASLAGKLCACRLAAWLMPIQPELFTRARAPRRGHRLEAAAWRKAQ